MTYIFAPHEWQTRPIVTLDTQIMSQLPTVIWHDPIGTTNSFTSGVSIFNELVLQVAFTYEKPYGGSAEYIVTMDTMNSDGTWQNVVNDHVGFYPDPPDTTRYTKYKDYGIKVRGSFTDPVTVDFRIGARIQGAGHINTGSGNGTLGDFTDPEYRSFRAVFDPVTLTISEKYLSLLELQHENYIVSIKDIIHRRRATQERKEVEHID